MSSTADLVTIRDYIRFATSQFYENDIYLGHGTDSAWDEAVALVLFCLHLPHDINPSVLDARLTETERKKVLTLIDKRVTSRIPLPYLTNEAWFCRMKFYVDDRVLIPRSPIGELIEKQCYPWVDASQVNRILDLCTGSGCIAIACASHFPEAIIDASDISDEALTVAEMNIQNHHCSHHVNLLKSDIFDDIPKQQYDLILSNPPYVDQQDMDSLPAEHLHEPGLALAAGTTGLDFAKRILHEAADYLTPNGVLILEVGNSEVALAETYPQVPFIWLDFEHGGGGVLMISAEDLRQYHSLFK